MYIRHKFFIICVVIVTISYPFVYCVVLTCITVTFGKVKTLSGRRMEGPDFY